MSWLGYAGLTLVAIAVLVALAAAVVALPPALRVRRASLQTRKLVELYGQSITLAMDRQDALVAERVLLMRPLRRLRRVVRHPLLLALLESRRIRRRRMREVAAP